jgi:CubicO group peptidase (beta-lactamase class C family)
MKRTYVQAIMRIGLFWIILLMTVPLIVHPARAAVRTSALDVASIDAFVGEQVRRHGIPGLSLGIVEGDQIVHLAGYGTVDETGVAVTPQTPFLLASVSKPLTALAIMQLVEAGQVELDAPVQRYVPDFRVADPVASRQITVRHLLMHTSGIPVTSCDTKREAETLAQFVAELHHVELAAPVGTRHIYCSGNYNVLGRVIETVSGHSFASYMQQQVFAPLQMHHSFASEQEAKQDGLAGGHRWFFGMSMAAAERYNTSQLPSGYLISSAEDMTHFLIAQLNGGRFGANTVLSVEGIGAMQAPGVATGVGEASYGLGWKTAPLGEIPVIQHAGDNFYFHGMAFIEPRTRRGAVLLINANGALAGMSAFKQIEEGVAQLLAGQPLTVASSMSLGRLYLIVNAVLGVIFVLALWSLLRLRRWRQHLQQRQGYAHRVRVGFRVGWDFGVPLMLLLGIRQFIGTQLGAQSWLEILQAFPDFTVWLWAICLLMLVTGTSHLVLLLRVLRKSDDEHGLATPTGALHQQSVPGSTT